MMFDTKHDERWVRVNGVDVLYISDRAYSSLEKEYRSHGKGMGDYWDREKEMYWKVSQYWYAGLSGKDWREISKIAGIKTVDFAVPQPWFEAHLKEIKRRGGVCWVYDKNSWGEPMFFDTLKAKALTVLKKYAPAKPATTSRYPGITKRPARR